MSHQEAVAVRHAYQTLLDQSIKPTFAVLNKAICDAAESVDLSSDQRREAFSRLKDQLFLSVRLAQWQLDEKNKSYWLKTKDQVAAVSVREDKVVLSVPDQDNPRYPFNYDIIADLTAATLFKSIQDAQAIVQSRISNTAATGEGDDFFESGSEEPYYESAGLDAALEETHAEPLGEDDAELIEDITAEEALNADQRREDGPEPIATVSQKFIDEVAAVVKPESFTAKANRKNATTDGVECEICGNLNRDSYKGTCPQCPKKLSVTKVLEEPKGTVSASFASSRLKSLQGRILNIVEAAFSDKQQREAVKTLINKEFRREITKASGE